MHTVIIAEAGVNHNGSLELAKRLADAAKQAGADCVKFQTFRAENIVTAEAEQASYQKKNTGYEISQREMLKKLELSFDDFRELKSYCDAVGIAFLSTPFDMESIAFLETLDMAFWKIPSGEITDYPYLRRLAQTGKPVVMSTGMSTPEEIRAAVQVLKQHGSGNISLLHCTTEYPAPVDEVNLSAIGTLKKSFGVPVGYSDHTEGILAAVLAVGMGAAVIEKHFTLDKDMEGPDHRASLEPDELAELVRQVRLAERMLGDGRKCVTKSEEKNRSAARKSIVARKEIRAGDVFCEENLTTKRPGTGINPMRWNEIIGKTAKKSYMPDEFVEEE